MPNCAPYFADDSVTLYHGDAATVLLNLPDASVNCIVTSPPYFGLRDYGVEGQIGLELKPEEYVEAMAYVFAQAYRVLAADGTLWLNLGDSYSTPTRGSDKDRPTKSLLGIPWRVAFALQDQGWILRQEVIWAKRNFMPESVKDRPTRSHEQLFLFSKQERYFYDADAIREDSDPAQEAHNQKYAKEYTAHSDRAAATGQPGNVNSIGIHSRPGASGRNSRSVWTISTTPTPWAHFATFPEELPRRCIAAGCKPSGVVLDPFSGSGTTGLTALKQGHRYVGIDLNAEYLDLSLSTRLQQGTLTDGATA